MKLHLVSGNLWADDAGAAGVMETEVWSRLPDELILEALRFVPVAQQFQLHSLSRKWRHLLTSADFRRRSRPVFAYVTRCNNKFHKVDREAEEEGGTDLLSPRSSNTHGRRNKVVDIDLLSFVPKSFWPWCEPFKPKYTYSVVAAADGLVCISNERRSRDDEDTDWYEREAWETCMYLGWNGKPSHNTFCVLNPVTRTFEVLPLLRFEEVLWLPPTSAALTVLGYVWDEAHKHEYQWEHDDQPTSGWNGEVLVATYDLTAGGSGRWDVAVAYKSDRKQWRRLVAAVCAGETFVWDGSRLRVLAPGGPSGRLVEVAAVSDEPSLAALPGVDPDASDGGPAWSDLVAHRGAVFLVKGRLVMGDGAESHAVVGVWRGERKRLQWEAVARLDLAEVEMLAAAPGLDGRSMRSLEACGVREFLCVCVGFSSRHNVFCKDESHLDLFVGLNLDAGTGKWEVLNREAIRSGNVSCLFEIRPEASLAACLTRQDRLQQEAGA